MEPRDNQMYDLNMPRYREWMDANAPYQKEKTKAAHEAISISYSLFIILCGLFLGLCVFFYSNRMAMTNGNDSFANMQNEATNQVNAYQSQIDQHSEEYQKLLSSK